MISATTNATRFERLRRRAMALALALLCFASLAAATVPTPPGFDKEFEPDVIGPGGTTTLVFTIDNSDSPDYAVGDLAFDDELPSAIELAEPALLSNGCGGTVTIDEDDADSEFDIRLTGGTVGQGATCEIVVNVTASTPGEGPYVNTSGDLTSEAGNSSFATASLTVDEDLPGFFKSFEPPSVPLGGRSTLTFTINNSANDSDVETMVFTDPLPAGMVVADPALASTDCENPFVPATLTAVPGTSFISLSSNGTLSFPALGAMGTCTVIVDVIGGAVGLLGNVTGDLLVEVVAEDLSPVRAHSTPGSVGKAAAVLEVTGFEALLSVEKDFLDDPVAPGGLTTLEFTVTNRSRDESATGITFSDDLGTTLTGLAPSGSLPTAPCGAGSSLGFAGGVLTLTGGSLAPEASCTFSVELAVPGTADPGSYTNVTGAVSGDVGGSPVTGNTATDVLFVVSFPVLTKTFTDDPVAAGDSVTLEFTVFNPDDSSAMTGITFIDELTDATDAMGNPSGGFLPTPVSVGTPPTDPCGAGSSLALVPISTDRSGLELAGGSLAASDGMVGGPDTCTFSITVDIPVGFQGGKYLNTTGEISATVSAATVVGPPASDSVVIAGAPTLTKLFLDDPVLPSGGPVTLELTLTYEAEIPPLPEPPPPDAEDIAFTDDLTTLVPVVPGLGAASVDSNTCAGSSVDISTDPTKIEFSGGTLAPETDCTVTLTLTVPPGSPVGLFTNTTSDVTASVGGVTASNSPGEDDLLITPLVFTKEFLDNPVIPGDTTTLRFTIKNNGTSSTDDATSISFSDDLAEILPGGPPPGVTNSGGAPTVNTCGGSESGTSTLLDYSGGSLGFGLTCTIEYELTVPAGAADGDYVNVTDDLSAIIDTSSVDIPPATDVLTVDAVLLALSKEFLDDPVEPGDTVLLELVLENLSATETVNDIAFDDDLGAVLAGLMTTAAVVNDCGGMAAGFPAALFEYSGGSLGPGASCAIVLEVLVPDVPLASGPPYLNTTTGVTGTVDATLDVFGDPASDELEIDLLTFVKSFDDPTTATGTALLSFTLTNLDPDNPILGLGFSDNLALVIPGLAATLPPTPDPPCGAGSTLMGAAGGTFLTFSGGSLGAAGSADDSCTFVVEVTVPETATAGDFLNATSDLFQFGVPLAGPATAFLTIEPLLPPTFAKAFVPNTIPEEANTRLTFTIDNGASVVAATGLAFSDGLPAAIRVANPASAVTTCSGGTITATPGTGTIAYTGGTVAASSSCTVSVDVTSHVAGSHVNTSGDLTSSSGNSGPASDTLTVVPDAPRFRKAFAPDTILEGGTSTLTFTIDNDDSEVAATGLAFSDNLPAAIRVASPTNAGTTCSGGTITATPGTGEIAYTGGTVAASSSCTVSVDVTSDVAGSHLNTSGSLTSSSGPSGSASDTLTVAPRPPLFRKAFAPDTMPKDANTRLVFTIDNGASEVAATGLAFTDRMPAAIRVASPANAGTTCTGGTITATPGTRWIAYTGGTVAASSSCTVSVDVTSGVAGSHVNTSRDLTSSSGNSGPASDTLTVDPQLPEFSPAFVPDTIVETFVSTLTFTIGNESTLVAADMDFLDTLPAGLEVAAPPRIRNDCGGSVVAAFGSTTISLSNGTLAAGATCTISVDVTANFADVFSNETGDLTSTLGNSGPAAAELTVVACAAADGLNLTLGPDVVLGAESYEVCDTITLDRDYVALGPNGVVELTAGVAVRILDGVEFGDGSTLTIELDPSLTKPPMPPMPPMP